MSILIAVDVDCDVCMQRFVVGACSVREAKGLAKKRGAKQRKGEFGEIKHECSLCSQERKGGHKMSFLMDGAFACSSCGMSRHVNVHGKGEYTGKDGVSLKPDHPCSGAKK